MMTSSNRNIFRVSSPLFGEFTVHRSFDDFFHLCLNKRLSKQSWGWWFETPLISLWRHCNDGVWRPYDATSPMSHVDSQLQWHHNVRDGAWNHRRLDCLPNRLFRCRSRKRQSSASLSFVRGIRRWPLNVPHKGSVTRKMFIFDDVIMSGGPQQYNFV